MAEKVIDTASEVKEPKKVAPKKASEAAAEPKAKKPVAKKAEADTSAKVEKTAKAETVKAEKVEKTEKAAPKAKATKKNAQGKQPLYIGGRFVVEKQLAQKPSKGDKPYELTNKKIKITLVRSVNGCLQNQQKTIEALGLKKINQFVTKSDNDAIRGMIFKVKHLVKVENIK